MPKRKRERHRGQGGGSCGSRPHCVQAAIETAPVGLTPEVIRALDTALADERNARATYQVIHERFGDVRPFPNTIHAEARHVKALHSIYERYGVRIPDTPGKVEATVATKNCATLCKIAAVGEVGRKDGGDRRVSAIRDLIKPFAMAAFGVFFEATPIHGTQTKEQN